MDRIKETIKETIVVEGKDDEAALKRAVNCEIIITRGFALSEETLKRIEYAAGTTGVIVLTDPDFAGERIRERIAKRVPSCKHAFLSKEDATLKDNIGIENASSESIREALGKVRTIKPFELPLFTKQDLFALELEGFEHSSEKRNKLGKALGIGYCNAKQFLNRLNHYGVTREEFVRALKELGYL
ncbi:MAG TPA: ribonuclease M5 [Clostridiales bacterium UBA8960]|jgi:ribonuclease M5|nr:ribonuclease M5 [Clostridiales bacterium UBA8960]